MIAGDFSIEFLKAPKLVPPGANIVIKSDESVQELERQQFNDSGVNTKLPIIWFLARVICNYEAMQQ